MRGHNISPQYGLYCTMYLAPSFDSRPPIVTERTRKRGTRQTAKKWRSDSGLKLLAISRHLTPSGTEYIPCIGVGGTRTAGRPTDRVCRNPGLGAGPLIGICAPDLCSGSVNCPRDVKFDDDSRNALSSAARTHRPRSDSRPGDDQ